MTMRSSSRDFPAEWFVLWPGEATYMCDRHMKRAKRLAEAMGFRLEVREAAGDSVCTNCENELGGTA